MNQNFKNMVSKLGVELLQTVRDAGNQVIDDAVFEERVSFMENQPAWHWRMPNKKELKKIMEELNISKEELEQCRQHM